MPAPAPSNAQAKGQVTKPMPAINGKASKKLTTIATPPPRGVGTECELRVLGMSIRLRARA
ncbi:hypothetical protein D3C84_1317840 [compost metagenome]